MRPTEVDFLLADPSYAKSKLNWDAKVSFDELVMIMVDADMELEGLPPIGKGKEIIKQKGFEWLKKY